MFIKIILLAALVKLLIATDQPFLCSGLYTVIKFLIALAFGAQLGSALLFAAIAFVLASIYFWLLDYFDETFWWWIILLGGLAIGLV